MSFSSTASTSSSSLPSMTATRSSRKLDSSNTSSLTSKARGTAVGKSKSEDDDDPLQDLFQASLRAYEEAAKVQSQEKRHFSGKDDMIRLEEDDDASGRRNNARPMMQEALGESKRAAIALNDKGKRKAIDVHIDRMQSQQALKAFRDQGGKRAAQRLSREERAKTAGSDWYGLPAFPTEQRSSHGGPTSASSRYASSSRGPTAEEMKREVQAIRLRNAMDPKRFYKGGAAKDKGMPAFAQLGKIIASPLEPKSYMTKAERGRTVVEELVKDAEAAAYAKRKFSEHQVKAAAGGRGHSKAKTRKPGDRKRQRR